MHVANNKNHLTLAMKTIKITALVGLFFLLIVQNSIGFNINFNVSHASKTFFPPQKNYDPVNQIYIN